MRVLHVDSGLTFRGGQQQVLHLALGLREAGVEQELVLRRGGELESRVAEANLRWTALSFWFEGDLASAL